VHVLYVHHNFPAQFGHIHRAAVDSADAVRGVEQQS
jgi:hypothetical protein